MSDQKSTKDTDGDEPTQFSVFIAQHARGRVDRELADALRDVIQASRESGKAGSITLKINVKALNDNAFEFTDAIAVKKPSLARAKSIWFANDDGQLTRDNPHQLPLGFQETNA